MPSILSNIASLIQYIHELNNPNEPCRADRCDHCGRSCPRKHGKRPRKADRLGTSDKSMNPIFIQRYYCPECKKTFSVLPECIPPHRWYLWDIQQTVFVLSLLGKSAYRIAKESTPSHHTITRWLKRFQEQFLLHKDALCVHYNELGRSSGVMEFWLTCFKTITLGAAMRLCHVAEVVIP